MSPDPPSRLVTRGAYRFLAHPIYTGAVITCAGTALLAGSPSGLLIVTPVLALAAMAFVLGYERDATAVRFGRTTSRRDAIGWLGRSAALDALWSLLAAPWRLTCRGAERVANSWGELTIGPVRLLSHGVYAAAGAFVGTGVAIALAGPEYVWWITAMALGAEAGAAAWAQLVEGSPQLLRPYGYFGSVAAVIAIALLAGAAGADGWRIAGAFTIGASLTQALGRIRCLVQGCCHGRPVDAGWGIRFTHPRSRVVRLSGYAGVPLHPTQLYAIIASLTTAAVLLTLWRLALPLPFITGSYFVLNGLARFVEEHYRGEPQTPWLGGLRLYQWLAIAFVLGGAAVTSFAGDPAPPFTAHPSGVPVLLLLALVTYIAYGVDFPRSSRRLSRLV